MDPGRAAELGRRGGYAKAAKLRAARGQVEPYAGDFLAFREAVGRGGVSRALWAVLWRAVDGLLLTAEQLAAFRLHTGRQHAPTSPCRELWLPAGRRSGKSENAMLRASWRAISRNWTAVLSPGEVGTLPVIASDRDQARNSLRYLKGIAQHPLVKPYVARVLRDSVEFRTGAIVRVHTASWRATRGYTMLDAVLEECAFYQAEDSANPDEEILAAIRPALLTVPDARVYGVSSPYARRGILHAAYREHWGRDGDDVLVFSADTASLNPTVSAQAIARAFEDDPARAASEYGRDGLVAFRADVESFLSREAVEAVTVPGRRELAPATGLSYVGFVDVSGGSQDSYTLAIAHTEDGVAVLDALRETRPPFSPEQVTGEYAALLRSYHLTQVTGDKYGGEFPRELFAKAGIEYRPSERVKSDLYREVLAPINSGTVALLDDARLQAQLVGLERRVARGGKDSIDHAPGAHDDLANAACGALVLAGGGAPGDGWIEWVKSEAIRGGGPLPASATAADYARRGGTVETIFAPGPPAPTAPARAPTKCVGCGNANCLERRGAPTAEGTTWFACRVCGNLSQYREG